MAESGSQSQPDDALVDLLIKQVTEGLSPAEQRALEAMDAAAVSEQLAGLERAAAAVTLAGMRPTEPPEALRALLQGQGERYFAATRAVDFRPATGRAAPVAADPVRRAAPQSGLWGWLAAAACLVLAAVGWLRTPPTVPPPVAVVQPVPVPPAPPPPPPAPPTPAEERMAMLADPQALKVTLGATKDPAAAGVTGDVVWDPVSQKGFLHFAGLATNDPQVRQYQIWIFDAKRDKRYPVDAGVFDVPAGAAEVVIPLHSALPISVAKAFAVTVEKPGGVVVSALGHVVALGAAGAAG